MSRILFIAFVVIGSALAATVARADLLINVTPSPVTIPAGQSGSITIESQPQPGFPSSPPADRIEYSLMNFSAGSGTTVTTQAPAYAPVQMTISVPAGTAPGTYRGTIHSVVRDSGGAAIGDKDFADAVTVVVPQPQATGDYTVSVVPNPITVAGGRQLFTFTLTSAGGFSGQVSVRMGTSGAVVALNKDCPQGTFCPYTETVYTLAAGGSVSDQAIASTTGPGGGTIVIFTKTNGLPDKTTSVPVTTQQGSFALAASPQAASVAQNGSSDVVLTLTRSGGFTGSVTVTAFPTEGVTVNPNPVTFAPGETMKTVRVSVARTAPATTTNFSFVGSSSDLPDFSASATLTLTVTPAEQPDFTVVVTPPALTLAQGTTNPAAATIAVNRSGGFTGPVNVTLSAPAGVTLSESSFTLASGQSSRAIAINVDRNATVGPNPISIVATAPDIPKTITSALQLTVSQAASPAGFTFAAAPLALTVTAGRTADVTLTVARQNFNGPVNVTAIATPAGVVVPAVTFAANETTRVVTIQASQNAVAGPGSIEFTATSPDLASQPPRTATVALTVVADSATAVPVITALMPSGAVAGTQSLTVLMSGQNFANGAVAISNAPTLTVESTRVLLPTLAEVTLDVAEDAPAGRVRLDLRNPDGGRTAQGIDFLIYESGDIGAPLGVTSAAIVSPLSGKIIGTNDRPHAVGAVATSGTGTIRGRWLFDDGAFDAFTITVAAGEPAIVTSRVPIPASFAGTHRLQLVIDEPQYAQAAVVRIEMSTTSASGLTILGPAPTMGKAVAPENPMTLRWSMVPGALGYHVELEKNGARFGRPVMVGQEAEVTLSMSQLSADSAKEPSASEEAEIRGAKWRWRVAPIYCCIGSEFYPGEFTEWADLQIPAPQAALDPAARDAAIEAAMTRELREVLGERGGPREAQERVVAPPPAVRTATPAKSVRKDFVVIPAIKSTWKNGGDDDQGTIELSGQGDLGFPPFSSKYTTDFTGTNLYGDDFTFRGSRSWVASLGDAKRGTGMLRPQAIVGYATPDFFSGAQLVSSSIARGGAMLRVGSRYGSVAYFTSLTDELDGIWSGNFGMRQKLTAAAYELPSTKRFSLKLLTMRVEDLPSESKTATTGTGRSFGFLGTFNVSPLLQITAEAARGEGEWQTRSGRRERDGGALRLGLTGNRKRTSYRFDFNHTDGDFVNPASRGFSTAAIPNRTGGSLSITNPVGKGNATLTLRHQVQSKATSSAYASGLNAQYSLPVTRRVMLSASGNYNIDRGEADAKLRMPRVERDQAGAQVTLSETISRFNFSQTLSHQQLRDDVNTSSRNDTDSLTMTGGGSVSRFLQLSASASFTQSEGVRFAGRTDSITASFQPTISVPRYWISFQPRIGYTSSDNDTTRNSNRGEQYAALLNWNPPWLHKIAGMQLSANWDRSESDTAYSSRQSTRRTYAGTFTLRWGAGVGPAFFRAMAAPDQAPVRTSSVTSANPVNGRLTR